MNLYKKNLLFRSHPRSPVYATAVSLVLIGRMWTMCRPKPHPPPSSPPICLKSLTRDIKRTGVGRGRSRCWSSPVSCAPTEFSHSSDPSFTPEAPVIFDGSPFSGQNTPVGAPEPKMSPPRQQRSLGGKRGREGGYQGEEKSLVGGGGGGRAGKGRCCIFNNYDLKKKSLGRCT
jgi:hypothetical protein